MSTLRVGGGASLAPPPTPGRPVGGRAPIGGLAFLGIAVTSLGGPVALVASLGPRIIATEHASAWFAVIASAVAFGAPLLIWLRYGRDIASAGGLYSFVEAAAGRPVALVQAGVWTISYLLYLIYTTASIVYDVLPAVIPGIMPYRSLVEVLFPVVLAGIVLAGRSVALAVTGVLAAGQLILVAVLGAVGAGHGNAVTPFGAETDAGSTASGTAQIALFYICGSLPLFFGGEVAAPHRTMRRGLLAAFALVAAGVIAVVPIIAHNPHNSGPIPGMSVAQAVSGHGLAVAVGWGVAASVAGVMLIEYLALGRLLHAVTSRSLLKINAVLAVLLVATAPLALLDPDGFVENLEEPSLYALWASQLIVVAVYPRYIARRRRLRVSDIALTAVAAAFCVYGFVVTAQHASS